MGSKIPTAAADQNFAWICKQHKNLNGSVLSFRTKVIWSGPEFGLERCEYLNAASDVSDSEGIDTVSKGDESTNTADKTIKHCNANLKL